MKKVVYLPLDERPCNASFPVLLFSDAFEICVPPVLSEKKTPVRWDSLQAFLKKEAAQADGLVISMDMLLYGGLIPSRIHHLQREEVMERLGLLRELKACNPQLTIYAYQCIMRCPRNSSSDEEPDYYADCGREICLLGEAKHRYQLGLCERKEIERLYEQVPDEALKDYLDRREFNLEINLQTLELVKDGILDGLVFPQDDCQPYGFTAQDQERIRERIAELRLRTKVLLYPGADELGLTTMARMLLHFEDRRPRVYVKMASVSAGSIIPPFEDRPLGETIKYHIIAAGCRLTDSLADADIVLGVSFPGCEGTYITRSDRVQRGYYTTRNLTEFVLFLEDALDSGKIVTVADNAYANGADPELIALLDQYGLLGRLQGYAGWNTSSNTMGTAIAEGVHAFLKGMTPAHRSFIALRYVEDAGYCSAVRQDVVCNDLPRLNYDYLFVGEKHGEVSRIVEEKLRDYVHTQLPSVADHISILDTWMPWKRTFEVGLNVEWREGKVL